MPDQLKPRGRVLVVDDEDNIREIIRATLKNTVEKVFTAESGARGLECAREENLDLVISDIQMPELSGIDFLKQLKEEQPEVKFLMITAFGSMDKVIQCLRYGASDFLTKPFDNNNLRQISRRLIEEKSYRGATFSEAGGKGSSGLIGKSKIFQQNLQVALKAAQSNSNILILGESGTGKEVMARYVHDNSPLKEGPFIAVNCGAIPDNLLESELFGYEKGAFTGALEKKPGKFVLAENGTVFLDEIGEMPTSMQVKLLRVLQERTVDPVGASAPVPVNFRLIAATNQDLDEKVATGEFREDLFYRLNVIPFTLPPLRERGEDSLLLAEYFLEKYNRRYDAKFEFSPEDRRLIEGYSWPGNIRELENIVERAVVLGDKNKLFFNLPSASHSPKNQTLKDAGRQSEREEIIRALEKNRWNKTHTAKELGVSRRSLLYKVKEYNIQ